MTKIYIIRTLDLFKFLQISLPSSIKIYKYYSLQISADSFIKFAQ